MRKYIDAEKLKAEINNLESFSCVSEVQDGFYSAISRINDIIDSLQQEQPEVDLDFQSFAKEMDSIFALPKDMTGNTEENPLNWEYAIARHFYELGLKVKEGKK